MAEVTLINPPSPFLADDRACPPLGLLYVAASLERAGIGVRVLDLASDPDWESKVRAVDSPISGVGCVTPNYTWARRIAETLPPNTLKLVGGAHPSALPEETLADSAFDVVVAGEAEAVIADIVRRALRGEKLDPVIQAPPTPSEEIGIPARHAVDLRDYQPEMSGDASTTLISSRGCPFRCHFCYKMYDRNTVRFHPLNVVLEEIEQLNGRFGYRNLVFADDHFLMDASRVRTITSKLKQLGIAYRCIGRADRIEEDILRLLAETGCAEISFGIESGSQRMLDAMNKKVTVERQKQSILAAKRAGLVVKAFFVVGFPGENDDSIEETKRFFAETMPHKWLLSVFSPLPGSETWRRPERFGIEYISKDFDQYWLVGVEGRGGSSFETRDLSRDRVRDMHRLLYDTFQSLAPMDRAKPRTNS